MEYIIVSNYSSFDLSREVKKLLDEGWFLTGNLVVTYNDNRKEILYSQALVK